MKVKEPSNRERIAALGVNVVDRENRVIRGRVVAELGVFKTRRGQFRSEDLSEIVRLGNLASEGGRKGLLSRWTHPNASNDSLGKHLGYDRNFRLEGTRVLSDFYLSDIAFKPPVEGGEMSYGEYILSMAEDHPEAFGSSLVLSAEPIRLKDEQGNPLKDEDGDEVPPAWNPLSLKFIDVVGTGDAVNSFLSGEGINENNSYLQMASELMDEFFEGGEELDASLLRKRAMGFLDRYIEHRYGESSMSEQEGKSTEEKLDFLAQVLDGLNQKVEALTAEQPESNDEGEVELDAAQTIKTINELSELCGHKELAGDLAQAVLAGDKTIEQAKDELLEIRRKDSQLDSGNPTGSQPVPGGKQKSIDEELGEEYDANIDVYRTCGLSRETFIKDAKIERGLDKETHAMLGADVQLQGQLI